MSTSDLLSLFALGFSIIAFIITFVENRRLHGENMSLQRSIFYLSRNIEFEAKLAEWPDSLKFFGIDVKDIMNKEGISEHQLTYLIMSVHALTAYCKARKEDIYEHIKRSKYRKAWKYARILFEDETREAIDKYLIEEYPDEALNYKE